MLRVIALALACALTAGCYFEHPLTESPSKDINTWLLGEWEHTDAKGRVYRAGVVPLTGDRYAVWFRGPGRKRQARHWEFDAWISRVGPASFLTLKCNASAGEVPEGGYVFAHYQVVDQNTVNIRPLELDAARESSSKSLRAQVRRQLKDKTLLPQASLTWRRVSEGYWDPGYTGEQPYQPLRFPSGETSRKGLRGLNVAPRGTREIFPREAAER